MNSNIKVSVIIPIYNTERYLRECLDSVAGQTLRDIEVICVNDGSTDSSGDICDEYAQRDSRFRVIHQQNRGQGYARNVGIDRAAGKYVIFLDSDDRWCPEALETLYAEAERNNTQVLCFGATKFEDGTEKIIRVYRHTGQIGLVRNGADSVKTSLDAVEFFSESCFRFYLLEYLRSSHLRFDEGSIHEDTRFTFLSCLLAERIECIDAQLYWYRERVGSTMVNRSAKESAHGICVGIDGLLDAYEERPLSDAGREQLERFVVWRINKLKKQYDRAAEERKESVSWIQRDSRRTLKRARKRLSLPWSARLATYSLYADRLVRRLKRKLKKLKGSQ